MFFTYISKNTHRLVQFYMYIVLGCSSGGMGGYSQRAPASAGHCLGDVTISPGDVTALGGVRLVGADGGERAVSRRSGVAAL